MFLIDLKKIKTWKTQAFLGINVFNVFKAIKNIKNTSLLGD